MELREIYKTNPFVTYVLAPDTKITPGARQFLVDRRVALVQAEPQLDEVVEAKPDQSSQLEQQESWSTLRLRGSMDRIEATFFLTALELLHYGDAVLSEEVMALGRYFRNVRKAELEKTAPSDIQFWGWTEEEIKNALRIWKNALTPANLIWEWKKEKNWPC
ncbi:hypothetical protein N752_12110 [Desulforamulus aquiferis]|nr:hypothetical protein [Desulforamulus aquiferis]RYD04924.1 hypothetical protein N752_12110 [Desulforamulus aquiferis]